MNTVKTNDVEEMFMNILNVYNETFKDRPKKFMHNSHIVKKSGLKQNESDAIRYTSSHPTQFIRNDGSIILNDRKLNKTLDFCMRLQIKNDLRYSTMLNYVLFNYDFVFSLFKRYFDAFGYSFHDDFKKECEWVLEQGAYTENGAKSILMQFLYICNMKNLNSYPDSFALQVCSRILGFYGISSDFTKFIDDCDEKSIKKCALVAAHQSLPLNNGNIRLVKNFQSKIRDNIATVINYILTDRIEIFIWNRGETCQSNGTIKLPDLVNDEFFKLHYYESAALSDNVFVTASKHSICSLNFVKINFIKTFPNEEIKTIHLIGKKAIIIYYAKREYFDIISMKEGKTLLRQTHDSEIEFLNTNRHPKLTWTDKDNKTNLYVGLVLNNSKVYISQVNCNFENSDSNDLTLNLIFKSKPFASKILTADFSMNYFDPTRKLKNEYFLLSLDCNVCYFIEFNETKMLNMFIIEPTIENTETKKKIELKSINMFIDGYVRMAEPGKAFHLYDFIKQIWLKIPGDFGKIKIRSFKNDLLIMNFKDRSFELYRIFNYTNFNKETKSYSFIRIINGYQFDDNIIDVALRGENYCIIFYV